MDCSDVLLIMYQSLRGVTGCVQRNTSIWDDPASYDKRPAAICKMFSSKIPYIDILPVIKLLAAK